MPSFAHGDTRKPLSPISLYRAATFVELPPEDSPYHTGPGSPPHTRDDPNINKLTLQIGGMRGYPDPRYMQAVVQVFSSSHSTYNHASMDVVWDRTPQDPSGLHGRWCLQTLFNSLSSTNDQSPTRFRGRACLEAFRTMSISIPDDVYPPALHDRIDLTNASSLQELFWVGQHHILMQGFRGLAYHQLTDLSLTRCAISEGDAWTILSCCLNVIRVQIDHISDMPSSHVSAHPLPPLGFSLVFPSLRRISISSTRKLVPFVSRLRLPHARTIRLFSKTGRPERPQLSPIPCRRWEEIDSHFDGQAGSRMRMVVLAQSPL